VTPVASFARLSTDDAEVAGSTSSAGATSAWVAESAPPIGVQQRATVLPRSISFTTQTATGTNGLFDYRLGDVLVFALRLRNTGHLGPSPGSGSQARDGTPNNRPDSPIDRRHLRGHQRDPAVDHRPGRLRGAHPGADPVLRIYLRDSSDRERKLWVTGAISPPRSPVAPAIPPVLCRLRAGLAR
jgi:hypothetical protein